MKTYVQKPADVERQWHLVDAKGKILGRVATEIAQKLIGKHKPTFTPHVDGGDFVVVINVADIAVTGGKETKKVYYRHSGYAGSLKEETLADLLDRDPTEVIRRAVYNMVPKNKLRSPRMNRLKIYATETHPHQGQLKPSLEEGGTPSKH